MISVHYKSTPGMVGFYLREFDLMSKADEFMSTIRESGGEIVEWEEHQRGSAYAEADDDDEVSGFQTPLPPHDPARWQTTDGFADEDRTNGLRAEEARGIIPPLPLTDSDGIGDIITNILHLAHAEGHDPLALLDAARRNFLAEAGQLPSPLPTDH